MWIQLLAFWHTVTVYYEALKAQTQQKLREWLGPAPESFYLLVDGRVLPSSYVLPQSVLETSHTFDPRTQRIQPAAAQQEPEGRWRRLPFIAGSVSHPSIEPIDFSDWLGDIRANPVPELPVKQILTLWSAVHHRYVPLSGGVQVTVTRSDGETDMITYE